MIGSGKGLKFLSPNPGLPAGREPGTSRCMLWGAQGGLRHLGELWLRERPRWDFGFFVTVEAPAAPGALAVSFRAVGQWIKAEARGWCVCRLVGAWVPPLAAGHWCAEPRGCGSLVVPSVPSANSLLNVPCRCLPGSDTAAAAANCRGAAEWGCRRCLKKIQSKIRQCQSISATPLGTGP